MLRQKNLAPVRFAAKVTSTRPPAPQACVVARGMFSLVQGGPMAPLLDPLGLPRGVLLGEVHADGDDERQGELLYPGDFADWKLRGEWMLRGPCFAPRGQPVRELPVAVQLGAAQKALLVTGPRVWVPGAFGDKPSEPQPFTEMLVALSTAFGGAGFAPNPAGKGLGAELPNVEDVRQRVTSRGDRPPPATFAPFPSTWPARAALLGKAYGPEYAARRPYWPVDFDGSHFQAAPADQQLEGFLRGDEELVLTNLHREHAVLRTRLPGLRVRAFVDDADGRAREIPLRLDTLFVDTDEAAAYLTWRGLTDVRDPELRDLLFALIVAEPLAEPARPADEHLAALRAFVADPQGAEEQRRAMQRRVAEIADEIPEPAAPAPHAATQKLMAERLGDLAGPLAAKLAAATGAATPPLPRPPKGAEAAEVDAAKLVDDAVAAAAAPGGQPTAAGQRREAAARVEAAVAKIQATRDDLARRGARPEQIEPLDRALAHPRLVAARAEAERSRAPEARELVPYGKLAGRNLAELDLSRRALDGADLSGADLEGADLRGASLRGACLDGARLARCKLDGADLEGADLRSALAIQASFQGASLRAAKLGRAAFPEASLQGADLRDARASFTLFTKADLSGARLEGAVLADSALIDVRLEGASFARAELPRTMLQGAKAPRVDFGGARLDGTSFVDAELEGARFFEAAGVRAVFYRARCARADFRRAALPEARFLEAQLQQARFYAADLRRALFHLARLGGASLRDANLFEADFGRADLTKTSLQRANCWGASFVGATFDATELADANLGASTLRR